VNHPDSTEEDVKTIAAEMAGTHVMQAQILSCIPR